LSGDVPNALEELRKNSVAICIAHQHVSQLGKAGDRIREAILTLPQTKLVFALNNIEEAKLIAPEVIKLPHEKVVQALIKPTVIGHEIRLMKNMSLGQGVTDTAGTGQNRTHTDTVSHGQTKGGSIAHGTSEAESHAKTKGRSHAVANGVTDSTSTTRSHAETIGTSDTVSETETEGGGSGTGGSHMDGNGWNQSRNQGTSFSNTTEPLAQRWPDRTDSSGAGRGESGSSSDSDNWSDNENWSASRAVSHTDTRSETNGIAETEGRAVSHVETDTESESDTVGTTVGTNRTRGKNWATSSQHSMGDAVGSSSNQSRARSASLSTGLSESLAPIMANLPGAVHDLQKVTHMAAEFLNELPVGTAAIKTRSGGQVITAVVKFPEPRDYAEAYPGAAKEKMLELSPAAIPIEVADRAIVDRHLQLKAAAVKMRAPKETPEPKSFRVSGSRWANNPERKGGDPTNEE
jgi:hypothetical protein